MKQLMQAKLAGVSWGRNAAARHSVAGTSDADVAHEAEQAVLAYSI